MSVWGSLSLDFPYSVIYQQEGKPDRHRFRDQPYKPDTDEQAADHRGQAKQVIPKGLFLQNQY